MIATDRIRAHPSYPLVTRLFEAGETRVSVIADATSLPRDTVRAMLRLLDPERFAEWDRAEKERQREQARDAAEVEARRSLRQAALAQTIRPEPEIPMDKQREIVAAYRQDLNVEQIADLYGFHPRAVVNVLCDAGYAIALVTEAQAPASERHAQDRARAQGWRSA